MSTHETNGNRNYWVLEMKFARRDWSEIKPPHFSQITC